MLVSMVSLGILGPAGITSVAGVASSIPGTNLGCVFGMKFIG